MCSFSRTATRVPTVATTVTSVARMEAGDHSDVLVCASEYIADRLYFVTLKGRNSFVTSARFVDSFGPARFEQEKFSAFDGAFIKYVHKILDLSPPLHLHFHDRKIWQLTPFSVDILNGSPLKPSPFHCKRHI